MERVSGTTFRREMLAGVTTFVTMAYIIIVNPAILGSAGVPREASVTATILAAAFGTLLMGLYARRPFAVAPLMGENAFIAFTVVKLLGFSWEVALGAVFLSGILFILLTIVGARAYAAGAIPQSLKVSFAVGIGLFLAFVGLNETGIVVLGVAGSPVRAGNFHDPGVLLAVGGIMLMVWMMMRNIRGAIIIGIVVVTVGAMIFGQAHLPATLVSMPASIGPVAMHLDIAGALRWEMMPVLLTVFVMVFVDTLATLFGLSVRAGLLDEKGNLPQIERPMLVDALATAVAALLGTTTTGAYIESAAGIAAGGRTGLTSIVVAALFMLSLFFTPVFTAVPACAYGPALIVVGLLMLEPVRTLPFDDYTELVPAFITIILMVFTFNIGIGMTAGFVTHPLLKLFSGRRREVPGGMWFLGFLSLCFFLFAPH
jgi:adenine/guanine/hypoxanthine permease